MEMPSFKRFPRLHLPFKTDVRSKGKDWLDAIYHKGITWVFAHKKWTLISMILVLPLCAVLFYVIPKEKMPDLHQKEVVVSIDWNENIHVIENLSRTRGLLLFLDPMVEQQTGLNYKFSFINTPTFPWVGTIRTIKYFYIICCGF